MFRQIVDIAARNKLCADSNAPDTERQKRGNCANMLFQLHPGALSAVLEIVWDYRKKGNQLDLGHPDRRSDISGLVQLLRTLFPTADQVVGKIVNTSLAEALKAIFGEASETKGSKTDRIIGLRWEHLIYAYLIENTRVYEIFRRVLHEYRHGERLGAPSDNSMHWLRNTEELFFRDPAPFSITSIVSAVRPDSGASRRNAYWRMFGMDLNHGLDDGKPYPYHKADAANREFVKTLEAFFTEVWIAIENANNSSGPNLKDDAAIANLAKRLHDMLMTRRQYGNLSREEFYAVSMMAWFHLSLEYNSPIVQSLKAEGASEDERLKKIAERVKLPANGQSFYFFRLAEPMSILLIRIEKGDFNYENNVPALYAPNTPLAAMMQLIITNWSNSTGRNLKDRPKSVSVVR